MGGGIKKPAQSSESVGHGSKGVGKDRSNGTFPGRNVQGGGSVGALVCHRDLGGDRGDAHVTGGVPPSGFTTDHGDDGETRGRQRVGVPIGRGGYGRRGDSSHRGVHKEAIDDHNGEGGLSSCLCNVYRGGADAGDGPVGAIVGSRCGK